MSLVKREMVKRLSLPVAFVCTGLIVLGGAFRAGASLAARNGAAPGTPGVPYPNMPAIAPIGVRIDKYLDVPDSAKGPPSIPRRATARRSSATASTW